MLIQSKLDTNQTVTLNQLIYQHIRYNARQLYFSYRKISRLTQDYQLLLWPLPSNLRHQYQNPQVQLTHKFFQIDTLHKFK